jgi:hypothetical protein
LLQAGRFAVLPENFDRTFDVGHHAAGGGRFGVTMFYAADVDFSMRDADCHGAADLIRR